MGSEMCIRDRPTALIETPDLPGHAQSRRTTDPAQQAVHRRMDPAHHSRAMIQTELTPHGVIQQITKQKLIRKRQLKSGSVRASRGT